jgi:AraC family transcriptional regulator of adaptative response / DNA-3-methyladenine glycosylase II
VKAATTLAGRVAERYGENYNGSSAHLTRVFPSAEKLANADLSGMGIVGQRIAAIEAVAAKIATGEIIFDGTLETEEFVHRLCEIKGIGDWTAHYVALRVLSDPDAFPYSDLILRRAATNNQETLTPKALIKLAGVWRPWRAYAVIFLWKHYQQIVRNK